MISAVTLATLFTTSSRPFWLGAALGAAAGLLAGSVRAADYASQIKPIFTQQCSKCHGASQQKGGLRMDTAEFARKGGKAGPGFIPGKSSGSLIVQAIRGTHEDIERMPYKKPPLSESQMTLIAEWIDQGGAAPADEKPESARHWSFIPPERPKLPSLKESSHTRGAIDFFIQARLEQESISPAPEADRVTLLRRLSLDLTGLPPTPAEVDDFLADHRSDAYEREVERLLASAHYGERWGRWWLDSARYADSNGYSIDAPRQIWKYRDWVVSAMNDDLPFDRFAIEQLAGDLLPQATISQKVATGFNRNTQINQEGGIDPEQFRVESVVDRVNTFGSAFLGLTIGCAQCHDHKFDPITQREYYQLFAFFNSTEEDGHGKSAPSGMLEIPGEFENTDGLQKEIEELRGDLDRYLNTKGSDVATLATELSAGAREKLGVSVRDALEKPWSDLSLEQKRAVYAAVAPKDGDFKTRNSKLAKLEKREPKPVTTLVMKELETPRSTHILTKGDFTRPSDPVQPGVPAALHSWTGTLSNRLDLARWTVDPNNPLLARVIVNRVWQQYFGRGIVETENDFGTQGSAPSNPELLDWLACEFMRPSAPEVPPWSLKHLHRLIVSSHTYRQSSRVRPELATVDPTNRLLARQSRLRLEAELVRDVALSAGGLLAPEIGGPPVFPPQPDGVMSLGQSNRPWKVSAGGERFRRGLYTHYWRATPHPALAVFDEPDAFSACTRRIRSNTPLQALTLLNDQQFFEIAQALAYRLEKEPGGDPEKIRRAFRRCVAREPNASETERLETLLRDNPADRWLTLARVLLNLDETITRE